VLLDRPTPETLLDYLQLVAEGSEGDEYRVAGGHEHRKMFHCDACPIPTEGWSQKEVQISTAWEEVVFKL
jgi:hypothetical protein